MSTKVKKKNTKDVNDSFEELFNDESDNGRDDIRFNQDIETIQDYIDKMDELIDELYNSVKSDMMNQNNILYDDDLKLMKRMFTLGQIDILSRLSTQQQLRRL